MRPTHAIAPHGKRAGGRRHLDWSCALDREIAEAVAHVHLKWREPSHVLEDVPAVVDGHMAYAGASVHLGREPGTGFLLAGAHTGEVAVDRRSGREGGLVEAAAQLRVDQRYQRKRSEGGCRGAQRWL